ncbi:MAG: sugar phosphate isomerase/epimerase [Clostridia bacterium]|nr:sugar phosphate isomerase/epimerase [Clostridia bacterium]
MKLGVLTNLFGDRPLAEACDYFKTLGVEALEIGCGGYPGRDHCDPDVLLNDAAALEEFKNTIASRGLEISCLSVHGNPVHPDKAVAAGYHSDFEKAVLLCEKLGLDTLVTFSGCPGDHEGAKYPNWVTCPWPEDFLAILEWQWNEVLIPYWKKAVAFAEAHGVKRIALEMHPGFCVYNPETLLKLRAAVGPAIGANFDPSHLIWQGMDPVMAIRELRGAIYHFHAKYTIINAEKTSKNGVLDTKHYSDEDNRSWIFRSVGYGSETKKWKDIMSELVLAGYTDAVCIEHEDSLMAPEEGLEKAVELLKEVIIRKAKPVGMRWA